MSDPTAICARYFGSDGTLCSTHHGRFASPSEMRCDRSPTAPDPIREALAPDELAALTALAAGDIDANTASTLRTLFDDAAAYEDVRGAIRSALSDSTPSAPTLDVKRLAEALEGFKTERGEYRGITPERLAAEYAALRGPVR